MLAKRKLFERFSFPFRKNLEEIERVRELARSFVEKCFPTSSLGVVLNVLLLHVKPMSIDPRRKREAEISEAAYVGRSGLGE